MDGREWMVRGLRIVQYAESIEEMEVGVMANWNYMSIVWVFVRTRNGMSNECIG